MTLELGEAAEMSGRNLPRRTWQAVTQEEKVFSPWGLDDSREIKTGLRVVMRKRKEWELRQF